ncbi:hypothetical protein FRC10_008572 [Ceratobasidium sp. 414]|nr:hypothetical protein FRC10_008572 [Ceratobasidium sp. 414]
MSNCVATVTSTEPQPARRRSRRKPPAHITLPPPTFSPPGLAYSPKGFKHIYPATPGRSSATPATERTNPFFILSEEDPPVHTHTHRFPLTPKTPPAIRRPVLPPQVSLEHAFGVVRNAPGRKADDRSGTDAAAAHGDPSTACSPRTSKARKELNVPSPILSRSPSRCSLVSEVRSQPEPSEVKKKKKTRPRSRTVASEHDMAATRKALETPSFRSSAAGTPTTGRPRQISISEIPMFGCQEFGHPEDVFGLAVVQPPTMVSRRPNPVRRQVVQAMTALSGRPSTDPVEEHTAGKAASCGSARTKRRDAKDRALKRDEMASRDDVAQIQGAASSDRCRLNRR